ncbi:MAG: hypothetical protein WBN74_17295, partial [Candidatus Sulfotelmatobacter sp.]
MKTGSEENPLLENVAASRLVSVAPEDQQASAKNSHGESILMRLAGLADEFDAERSEGLEIGLDTGAATRI